MPDEKKETAPASEKAEDAAPAAAPAPAAPTQAPAPSKTAEPSTETVPLAISASASEGEAAPVVVRPDEAPATAPAPAASPAPSSAQAPGAEKEVLVAKPAPADAAAASVPVAKPAPADKDAAPAAVPMAIPVGTPRVRKPPLPPEYRGVMDDIRLFLTWGRILFLVGVILYLVAALMSFGSFIGHMLRGNPLGWAVESLVWAIIDIVLAAGAFLCFMLSRQKLMMAFEDNDYAALHRRLPLGLVAGIVFGVVVGGVLLMLAYVKVDELPPQYKGLPPPPPVQ